MRAVVTGGAGFIGSHVVDALLARGDEVVVVDNLASGRRENLAKEARFAELDIRDDRLADLFAEVRPDVCFHLAAQADVSTSVARPVYDAEVNVLGTIRVLLAADTATKVVFSSTGGAIYGECEERPAREDDVRRPLAPYGTAKLAAEEYIATWNRLHGTHHVVLRFGNVYGPRQLAALEGGVIAIFLERMAEGASTMIFGDGEQSRDFVYVGDVTNAVLRAPDADGGVYNVGTGRDTTILHLHELCRRVTGDAREPAFEAPRPGDLKRNVLDVSLIERDLAWRPATSLEDGLRITWDSIR